MHFLSIEPAANTVHRGAICQFLFRWIYYCHSSKSSGKKTGKTHLCEMVFILCKKRKKSQQTEKNTSSNLFFLIFPVPSSEQCLLPPRYRRRPEDCFATHDDEVRLAFSFLFNFFWRIFPPHFNDFFLLQVYECRASHSGSGNSNPHSLSHFSQLMMLFILLCLPG